MYIATFPDSFFRGANSLKCLLCPSRTLRCIAYITMSMWHRVNPRTVPLNVLRKDLICQLLFPLAVFRQVENSRLSNICESFFCQERLVGGHNDVGQAHQLMKGPVPVSQLGFAVEFGHVFEEDILLILINIHAIRTNLERAHAANQCVCKFTGQTRVSCQMDTEVYRSACRPTRARAFQKISLSWVFCVNYKSHNMRNRHSSQCAYLILVSQYARSIQICCTQSY